MSAASIAVSISMGVMKPVLDKLSTLMGDQYKKIKGLRKEVSFLRDELRAMEALLEKMDAADSLDSQAKEWRKDIIDMSYDIEDCIDDFMHRVGEDCEKVGILQKASGFLKTIKDRYRIANQIKKIKTRVTQTSQRRERYTLDLSNSTTNPVAVDPRLCALYKDSTTLVGLENQTKELVRWTMDEEQQLKVMSIVGFGGLGKTTLANVVYHEVKGHFNCNAFVSVSQKPDVQRLLSSVCSKLGLPQSSHACEAQELIDTLIEYLQDKRYFIVLDDLWEVKHWDIISCAFPRNSKQSKLIVTTRIEGVAQACGTDPGCIHYMKPLSDTNSRKLFFKRTFGTEDTCPPRFMEVSCEILKKCGGLPLAIITMASTLVDKPKEHWDYIQHSIVTKSSANSLDDMVHIIDLSYKHLPHHLRACFLYLGIYPKDYEIIRDELIKLWVAERIVMSKSPGQDVWDVGESCFNELVNRNMLIQHAESDYYKVHDMMLDLIIKRCREDNFVSVVHSAQVVVEREDRVRRLSVSLSGAADDDSIFQLATNCCRSQVRSLVSFGGSKWMPPLLELKSLRVLYLEFPEPLMRLDLTGIGQLSQLRYLKVEAKPWILKSSEGSIVLPYEIWRQRHLERQRSILLLPSEIWRLRHLERMEICSISVCITPSDVVDLPHLSHLILPQNTSLPDVVMKMKCLRTLKFFTLVDSLPENIKGLSKLNKLEELQLCCYRNDKMIRPRRMDEDTHTTIWMDALIFSLYKLSNLKYIWLMSGSIAVGADALLLFSPPFKNLELLCLDGLIFSRVPRWIGGLQKLRWLSFGAKQMPQGDIDIIGTLPCLIHLRLWIPGMPTGRIMIGGSTGFNALEMFEFNCDGTSYLAFEVGAMPSIRELRFVLDSHQWDKDTPHGLQYLSSLEKITVLYCSFVDYSDPGELEEETALVIRVLKEAGLFIWNHKNEEEAALIRRMFQEAADEHPSHPAFTLEIGYRNCVVRTKEEEEMAQKHHCSDAAALLRYTLFSEAGYRSMRSYSPK